MAHVENQRAAVVAVVCAFVAASGALGEQAGSYTIAFPCDGGPQERAYLFEAEPDRINYTVPERGPFRWAEQDWRIVYRFPVEGVSSAKIELQTGNRFAYAASRDGVDWEMVLREDTPASGLSNIGVRHVDLSRFLGGPYVYLRLTHGLPDAPGFGGCLFGVKLVCEGRKAEPPLVAAVWADAPPVIDGSLDETVWNSATPAGPFWVHRSRRPALQQSIGRILWDAGAVYIGIACLDTRPETILSVVKERDGEVYRDAAAEIFVEPREDGPYYHLVVNSLGTILDQIGQEPPSGWNPEWASAVRVTEEGWTVEARIPFSSINVLAPAPGDVWRFNLCRNGTSDAEITTFAPLLNSFHERKGFAHLRFEKNPARIEDAAFAPRFQAPEIGATGRVSGAENARIVLEVWPDAGNPARAQAVAEAPHFDLAAPVAAEGPGAATLALFVGDRAIQRGVYLYETPVAQPAPLVTQLKQPYYTNEADIEAHVTVNLDESGRAGAIVRAELVRDGKPLLTQDYVAPAEPFTATLPLAEVGEGDYVARFSLISASGGLIDSAEHAVHRLSPRVSPSRVELREDGTCFLNGEPFFPVIFFLAGGSDDVATAANTIIGGGEDPEVCAALLDGARQYGLMAMPHLCNLMRGNNDWDGLRATVSRNKNHPALLGWYLADEPEGTGDVPELMRTAAAVIREVDPDHPIIGLNNTPAVFAAYAAIWDVHMADPYPIPGASITQVVDWTAASRNAAGPTKPTWMCLQTHSLALYGVKDGRWPTPDELRCMMYLALIHGSKGIAWWCYNHAKEGGEWDTYQELFREVQALAPYLVSEEGEGEFAIACDRPEVDAAVWKHGVTHVLAVANPGEAVQATVTVTRGTCGSAKDFFTGEDVPAEGGRLTLGLPAFGTRVVLLLRPAIDAP